MLTPNIESTINENANKKPNRSGIGAFFWYFLFIFIIPLFVHISYINSLKKLNVKVDEAESGIDVQLKKRRDTLLKLMDAVKGSIKFEKETLTTVTAMRTGVGIEGMIQNTKTLDAIQKGINVQIENYPDLKSNALVGQLMSATEEIEDNIAAARRIYNSNASIFNQEINVWPKNNAACSLKYVTKYFFEITEEDRQDVKIDF
ncbi:LemA family protein [Spiroplasma helicoides]|uniref:LemA family protein n=1 Tax=Spiroplasma helicoides TaxID=216938 RepID=A0A1B3SJR8_9MOLU|nr:LemA family protein [Spiroplasma helicoides]AOG60175.1 LemA family protein [Spiroplasma helicoides]